MDGNGRWARQRRLPTLAGHRAGTDNIRRIIQAFADHGVAYLTLYAFSTENWARPSLEVRGLFQILREVIDRETEALFEAGVQVRHVGSLEHIPAGLARAIEQGVERTKGNRKLVLNVAFNYGGRKEILDAVGKAVAAGGDAATLSEADIATHLYSPLMRDPDLVIRTSGEKRMSNFLLWQTAYSELYFSDLLWPDFGKAELREALADYAARHRRFGRRDEDEHA